jgi:pyrroloquinoline quinone biosynthesis protein B
MIIKMLGTASIGGVPEWDCGCPNCIKARANPAFRRTRSSIAITLNEDKYIIIDTGHDIKAQLEIQNITPRLSGVGETCRESRIDSILLTHGHADHTVGLAEFCTGKSFEIPVYGPPDLIGFLFGTSSHPHYFGDIGRLARNYVIAQELKENRELTLLGGLKVKGFEIPHTTVLKDGQRFPSTTYAYEVRYDDKRLIYAPDLGKFTQDFLKRLDGADIFIMDATFWWDDELDRISGIPATSYKLGHVPQVESIEILRDLDIDRVIYTHFNHTNPVLDPKQSYQRIVIDAGQEIAYDGMNIKL